MPRLTAENEQRARDLIALYPQTRSALIPILQVAQEQDGWLTPEAMDHIGELLDLTAAEVYGTASFYDMLFTHPIGTYLVSVCTNIACLLNGGFELLEHAEERLGISAGGTTADGTFTLEEVECIALCGQAPCLTVNWRFFGDVKHGDFDKLVDDLRAGRLGDTVPPHGTLCRVRRSVGLVAAGAPRGASTAAAGAAGEGAKPGAEMSGREAQPTGGGHVAASASDAATVAEHPDQGKPAKP